MVAGEVNAARQELLHMTVAPDMHFERLAARGGTPRPTTTTTTTVAKEKRDK